MEDVRKRIHELAQKLANGMVFNFDDNDAPGSYFARIKENAKAGHKEQFIVVNEKTAKLLTEPPAKKDSDNMVFKVSCKDEKIFIQMQ